MKNTICLLCMIICITTNAINAEELKQTIRGTVIDKDAKTPLTGATVVLLETEPLLATITGFDGAFIFDEVPVGRHKLKISFIGYHDVLIDLFLTSGKETVINIELEEKIEEIDEVVVKTYNRKDRPVNEMALISARSFSIEETERFAGSLGDPARMVANYAGVMTQNDSRNDIIIRGNSPAGVIWRLDGIEVPNPNHFGSLGSTGGPVSMINNNLLTNSDFLTGAFTAEYGNALSGAFDLRMRSGNNRENEFTGQIGFNGFELGLEGPIIKEKKASYLINYRYSTLALMHAIGFGTETGSAVPYYQDLTFKIDFPGTKLGRFTIIGLGGKSKINMVPDTSVNANSNAYNTLLTHTRFSSDLGVVGISNLYFFNEKTRLETSISLQGTGNKTQVDSMNTDLSVKQKYYRSVLADNKASVATELKSKRNNKNTLSIGIIADLYFINYLDSVFDSDYGKFITVTEIADKRLSLIRSFGQWQHKFTNELSLYGGIHTMYFSLNNEISLEPRVSAQWKFHPKQSFNLGFGIHSQMQPRMIYFTQSYDTAQNKYWETNHNVNFSKSNHFVAGYNYLINENFRLKIESYYQYLYNIPVANNPLHFSMLNAGDNFSVPAVDSLVNSGKGKNYGVELTLEKFLSKGYYFLFTASVFDSKFKALDNKWRNTAFNGSFVFNALAGYEIKIGDKNHLTFDIKSVWAGGRRYVPFKQEVYDLIKAVNNNPDTPVEYFDEIYDFDKSYSARYQNYIRTDFRIGFKWNHKKYSEEFAIDLQNITNQKALFSQEYDRNHPKLINSYQQGFSPMFLYRIQF